MKTIRTSGFQENSFVTTYALRDMITCESLCIYDTNM